MRRRDHLSSQAERDLAEIDAALAGKRADGELAELALLVRDERPALDAGARARLDERAAAGFARRPAVVRRRMLLPALAASATVLVVAVGVYAGAGGDDGAGTRGGPQTPALRSGPAGEAEADAMQTAPSATPAPRAAAPSGIPSRSVQRAAQLGLATTPDRLDAVASDVMAATGALGGYVVSSNVESRGSRGGSATFQLRVPGARIETALARLSKLARVRSRSTSSLDVTGAVVSARERIDALEAERRGVLRQLASAGSPEQTAEARERLRRADRRLAGAKAHREQLRRRVAYGTIDVELVTELRAGAGSGTNDHWDSGDALGLAVRVLEVAAGALLVAIAALAPAALLAAFGWAAWRVIRSRRRNAMLDAAT